MADFGEGVRREKQAVIRKPLEKVVLLRRPLAFLSQFTKVGYEPLKVCIYSHRALARLPEAEIKRLSDSYHRHFDAIVRLKSGERS